MSLPRYDNNPIGVFWVYVPDRSTDDAWFRVWISSLGRFRPVIWFSLIVVFCAVNPIKAEIL